MMPDPPTYRAPGERFIDDDQLDDDQLDDDQLDALISRADLDGLVRMIDDRHTDRDWAGLARLRDRCRAAGTSGRQLWPATTLAEYRLTLDAPARWAVHGVNHDGGRFTVGPLSEVVAQRHIWSELAPYLDSVPGAALVAHEFVLRGDDLSTDPVATALPDPLCLPLARQRWEPPLSPVTYADNGITADPPRLDSRVEPVTMSPPGDVEVIDDAETYDAFRQLVAPWSSDSNGRAEAVAVRGAAADAVAALRLSADRFTLSPLATPEALAWLAWAGASGGAHGRRRGAAAGRFGMWWLLASLTDDLDPWPPSSGFAARIARVRWFHWNVGEPSTGWRVQLAVEDRDEGLAWAFSARDDFSVAPGEPV